jgi:hypothetical protein
VALAVDASSPAKVSGTATTITTASFTAPANALLVAFNNGDAPAATPNSVTVSDSLGLIWARAVLRNITTGANSFADIWYATTTSAVSRTVSAAEANVGSEHGLVVKVFTDTGGAPTVGATNSSFAGTSLPTCDLTTTANDSWAWATSSDWNTGGAGTAGSGQTISTSDEIIGSNYTGHTWRRTATTATPSTVTLNLTAPASQTYDECVIEIEANPGAAPLPALPRPRSLLRDSCPPCGWRHRSPRTGLSLRQSTSSGSRTLLATAR